MKNITKKKLILTLILFWFMPQVYVVMDCLQKGPCGYDYKLSVTFLIIWDLLPSLLKDLWIMPVLLLVILIAFIVAFFISTLLIREKKNF